MARKGDIMLAPYWGRGTAFFKVRVEGPSYKGSTLVTWLEGPLRNREARLDSRTLRKPDTEKRIDAFF